MDQDYIKTGKADWKLFQKRRLLKESLDDEDDLNDSGKDLHSREFTSNSTGRTASETQTQQSDTLKQLASNKSFAKIANNEQKIKMKSLYHSFKSISKALVPAFHEAIESGNVENMNAVLEDIKDESAESAKEATDAANKYIADFNKLTRDIMAGRMGTIGSRNIGSSQLELPYFKSLQDFAIYANLAAKNGDTFFLHLLPGISEKLGLGDDPQAKNFGPTLSRIAEAIALDDNDDDSDNKDPDPVGATNPINVPRAKNNVKNVDDIEPYKKELADFYKRLQGKPETLTAFINLGANIIEQIRIAQRHAALAAGIQKRQEVLKMMNTQAQNKLLNDIASGQAWVLDPEDPAFGLDTDTAKIIKHDFKTDFKYNKASGTRLPVTNDTLPAANPDADPVKEALRPGVGKIDTRGTRELYEERMIQDKRQSKIEKINEGWNAYVAKNKGKKITGEGDKFNIVMG